MAEEAESKPSNVIIEYLQLVISVVVIVFVVRSFIFEPFRIPSESMDPTLKTGDYVIVTKFSYGFGRQSVFDIPIINDRVFYSEPKRGNVVVFADPTVPRRKKLIKRVVGVPGDLIEVRDSILFINGKAPSASTLVRAIPTLTSISAVTSSGKATRAKTVKSTCT